MAKFQVGEFVVFKRESVEKRTYRDRMRSVNKVGVNVERFRDSTFEIVAVVDVTSAVLYGCTTEDGSYVNVPEQMVTFAY